MLNVCALGKTVTEAQRRAYEAVDRIKWPEGFCRRDIGWQAVEREKSKSFHRHSGRRATRVDPESRYCFACPISTFSVRMLSIAPE